MTGVAGDEIYEVVAFTSDVVFARENFIGGVANERFRFVEVWTELALSVGANSVFPDGWC